MSQDSQITAATHLASIEIIAGSVGHGFKIPFSGTLLSYYQLYICLGLLIRKQVAGIQVFNVSVIVALLKTLSPLGKKITPMIAIAMQGFLLWLGTAIFNGTFFGIVFGSILLVSWSLFQSIIGFILLYGFDFLKMLEFFQKEISIYSSLNIYTVIFCYWLLKVTLALAMILFVVNSKNREQIWTFDISKWNRLSPQIGVINSKPDTPLYKKILKDMVSPFFLLSLVLMTLFHLLKGSVYSEVIWFIFRTLAAGFLMFYLARSDWFKRGLFFIFGRNQKFRALYKKMFLVRKNLKL